jgi:hypothetical protein
VVAVGLEERLKTVVRPPDRHKGPGDVAEPVGNLIPLEFHIQKPISADAQGIALVVKSGLVGISIEIVIFLFPRSSVAVGVR